MSTDAVRRFFVRRFDEPYREGRGARQGWEVVDRTGFLPPTQWETRDARQCAMEVAEGRNTCELVGGHAFAMGDSKCSVCDASTRPDVE